MTKYELCYPKHTWDIVKEDISGFKRDMKEICDKIQVQGAVCIPGRLALSQSADGVSRSC